MTNLDTFTAKAQTLTTPELLTLGRSLNGLENCPHVLFDVLVDLVIDRDGIEAADQFSDALFA